MVTEQNKKEKIFFAAALTLLALVTLYKLAEPSLTVDEATEYWYSKYLTGTHPHAPGKNMYQRILMTYQPPLYNILMYFWLKISESVFHIRLLGVFCSAAAGCAIYSAVKKITNNYIPAVLSVIVIAFMPRTFYYWQEASEYCLLMCMQAFVVYFLVKTVSDTARKNYYLLAVFIVLSIFSQYGAVFTAAGCCAVLFINAALDKQDRKRLVKQTGIFINIIVVFAAILYFQFLKKQMPSNGEEIGLLSIFADPGKLIKGLPGSFCEVFKYLFITGYSNEAAKAILIIVGLLFVFSLFKGNKHTKTLVCTVLMTWVPYYLATKAELYAYGKFSTRHCLFIAPLLYIAIASMFWDAYSYLKSRNKSEVFIGAAAVCAVFCCVAGFREITKSDNGKIENNRGVVNAWYKEKAYNKDTLVYYGAEKSFAYHIRENALFKGSMEEKITYMPWAKNKGREFYKKYVENVWENGIPSELYLAATHMSEDLNDILYVFSEKGYIVRVLFSDNGKLIYLKK